MMWYLGLGSLTAYWFYKRYGRKENINSFIVLIIVMSWPLFIPGLLIEWNEDRKKRKSVASGS